MATRPHTPDHAALMDKVYRGQRHIYDLTRKYYLFGRDRLIRELDAQPGMAVLELGCGTGRNLELIRKAWPGVQCHGLDISSEMLKNARKRLGGEGRLALGDATDFDTAALFGREGFDRVVLSYALSMIPDWQAALSHAAAALAPGGSLHVVDFGDCKGLPGFLRRLLYGWLARFHVAPRQDLPEVAERLAHAHGLQLEVVRGPFGYYQMVRLTR
ncbi:class I SAM-dependent methyltransferase [Novosphingobium beihaiensis]|uniref:Class I SAM-dependent methyltransferase n=1 Tax=Novosphingobium beihaiensis TaxID=2930389 RepID=A0ABT0BLY2_9SPHN|nr:class I SAM-dependent methyltransferase [Novosphingobium beihaiensis]MCJ2186050.1 class I SAM-dependent methyltransferase [Novosphingobium beihaiensis]